jgi:hypothetical protein
MESDKMNIYLDLIRNFVSTNNLDSTDSRISLNVRVNKQRLVFVIGSRYSLCIEKIKNDTVISFISSKEHNRNSSTPFKNNKGEIEAYWNRFDSTQADIMITEIKEGLAKELSRNNICPYRKHSNADFNKDVFGEIITKKYWLHREGSRLICAHTESRARLLDPISWTLPKFQSDGVVLFSRLPYTGPGDREA